MPVKLDNNGESGSNRLVLGHVVNDNKADAIGFGSNNAQAIPAQEDLLSYAGDIHLATFGATGSGKGRSVLIPTLLTCDRPCVVVDPKSELYHVTANRRRAMGHTVVKLDPFCRVDENSDALNPLDLFKLPNADVETDSQTLASLLAAGNFGRKDPFWDLNACGLVSGIIAYLATGVDVKERNLNSLRTMLQGDDTIHNLVVLRDKHKETMNRMSYEEIAAFLNHAERETRPSVLSTALSYIKPLASAHVAKSLQTTTFSLKDVVEGNPLTIYLMLPPDRLASHKALLKLWIGTLLKVILTRTQIPDRRTLFLVDECAQLGHFPLLQTAITLCRGYGLQAWTFWQDLAQLKECYPSSWQTLLNNSGILQIFGITNRAQAADWSALLDHRPDELLALNKNEQIVRISGEGEYRSRRFDYLADRQFVALYDANPYFRRGTDSNGVLPPRFPKPPHNRNGKHSHLDR